MTKEEFDQINNDFIVFMQWFDLKAQEDIKNLINSAFIADDEKYYSFP